MNKPVIEITDTLLAGLKVLQRRPIEDSRGYFCRFFCLNDLEQAGFSKPIAQINHTFTCHSGAVRGLHFQYPPHGEIKIVSCLKGEIFDVALDIRRGSPTFLHWHAEILSGENFKSLLIPAGFAHGFQALSDHCELMYLHSEAYHPESEGAFNISDPRLAIQWPLAFTVLSDRDRQHPLIDAAFKGIN
jgi:dTDP-4-dehydrorhamnose 3,5-epimerase